MDQFAFSPSLEWFKVSDFWQSSNSQLSFLFLQFARVDDRDFAHRFSDTFEERFSREKSYETRGRAVAAGENGKVSSVNKQIR